MNDQAHIDYYCDFCGVREGTQDVRIDGEESKICSPCNVHVEESFKE